jgi:hypothetical protein
MAYLVADCNVQRSRLHTGELPSFVIMGADDGKPSNVEHQGLPKAVPLDGRVRPQAGDE